MFAGRNRLPETSHRWLRDPVLILARLYEIVGSLASQPELGIRPACLQCSVRRGDEADVYAPRGD